jgi:hypothetical protein
MHSYVDLYFTSESTPPREIAKRLLDVAGLALIAGPHDLLFGWETEEEFYDRLTKIREALKNTGVLYRVETVLQAPAFSDPAPWPPPLRRTDASRR